MPPSKFVRLAADKPTDSASGFWVRVDADNVDLFAREWTPPAGQPVKATVTFVHGLGEHSGRYEHVFSAFAAQGIYCFAWDQRGFGRTVMLTPSSTATATARPVATLGDSGGWQVSMDDIWRACQFASDAHPGVPHFIMGQSMGGLLAMYFTVAYGSDATNNPDKFRLAGCIGMSPAVAPGYHIPTIKRTVGSWASRIIGSFNIPTELDITAISSDPAVIQQYTDDPFTHGMGSLRMLAALLDKGDELLNSRYKEYNAAIPLLVSFGTADRLTSHAAGKAFVEKVECADKTFRSWEGAMHELHNEPEIKERVINEYAEWILAKAKTYKV